MPVTVAPLTSMRTTLLKVILPKVMLMTLMLAAFLAASGAFACSRAPSAPVAPSQSPASPLPVGTPALTPSKNGTPTVPATTATITSPGTATPTAPTATRPAGTATFPPIPPAWPFVFNGKATVGGQPVPAGLLLQGRIEEYRSAPVTTFEGGYQALPVGPLDRQFFERPIVFELTRPTDGKVVVAEQTLVFRALPEPSLYELNLTFPAFD